MDLSSKDQSLFELIKIFREKIGNFDCRRFGKDAGKASELRKKGNDLFASNRFEEAVSMYTDVSSQVLLLTERHAFFV